MNQKYPFVRWLIVVLGTTFCLSTGACLFVVFVGFISFPPTDALVRDYVYAVAAEDWARAQKLGSSEGWCQAELRASYLRDVAEFGGAEVRNLTVELHGSGGSDDSLEVGIASFEYRKPGEPGWKWARVQIMTDDEVLGWRYMCGSLPRE